MTTASSPRSSRALQGVQRTGELLGKLQADLGHVERRLAQTAGAPAPTASAWPASVCAGRYRIRAIALTATGAVAAQRAITVRVR